MLTATNINELPLELLSKISGFLEETKDRKSIMVTSKKNYIIFGNNAPLLWKLTDFAKHSFDKAYNKGLLEYSKKSFNIKTNIIHSTALIGSTIIPFGTLFGLRNSIILFMTASVMRPLVNYFTDNEILQLGSGLFTFTATAYSLDVLPELLSLISAFALCSLFNNKEQYTFMAGSSVFLASKVFDFVPSYIANAALATTIFSASIMPLDNVIEKLNDFIFNLSEKGVGSSKGTFYAVKDTTLFGISKLSRKVKQLIF